ncbi:hypothetical protein KHA94_08270 [Bacillus sp. FJAT-49705]|uniref:Uncharacterized protein n=1 Tax=Cytobacillus citreus TaxID=2833586 RepID=A0ABS5NQV3_9BACI|nr:hypothetical protein [Cytobacillus citreus]MBS4190196.1 hypothetical protein [Cytobacillus citreus]
MYFLHRFFLRIPPSATTLVDKNLPSFEIAQQKIEPLLNINSSDEKNVKEFTYSLNGKDIILSGNYGIPDDASNFDGNIMISINSKDIESYSNDTENRYIRSFGISLDNVKHIQLKQMNCYGMLHLQN